MREFDYTEMPRELMIPEIMNLVSAIREYKGRQRAFLAIKPRALSALAETAKVRSARASNSIEGISTSDKRLEELVRHNSAPRNRSEAEIAGYREALNLIYENYEYMPPRVGVILQLHRDMCSFSASEGGKYKNSDNAITQTDADDKRSIRFAPVSAFEAPAALEKLTESYLKAISAEEIDALILIPMFILDFLCIHPFNDGNGRISRLLTLLLTLRARFMVGKYASMETLIERTKDSYYDALMESSRDWHAARNSYLPFVRYMLGIILKAYREFCARVEPLADQRATKFERVKTAFDDRRRHTKRDIIEICPDISASTVEAALAALSREGYITKLNAGSKTAYIKND